MSTTTDWPADLRKEWAHARFSEKQQRWLKGNNVPMNYEGYLEMCIAYPDRLQIPWVEPVTIAPTVEPGETVTAAPTQFRVEGNQMSADTIVVTDDVQSQTRTAAWFNRLLPELVSFLIVIYLGSFLVSRLYEILDSKGLTQWQITICYAVALIIGLGSRLGILRLIHWWRMQTISLRRNAYAGTQVDEVARATDDMHPDDV